MASEMRVACVLCASHPCVRGGSAAHSHVSIQQWNLPCEHPAGHERSRACVSAVGGVAQGTREEPHGEEPSGWVSRGSCAA